MHYYLLALGVQEPAVLVFVLRHSLTLVVPELMEGHHFPLLSIWPESPDQKRFNPFSYNNLFIIYFNSTVQIEWTKNLSLSIYDLNHLKHCYTPDIISCLVRKYTLLVICTTVLYK